MRDRLDRLGKLGFLDVNAGRHWRDVRNRLAHEYPGSSRVVTPCRVGSGVQRWAAVAAGQNMATGFAKWKASQPAG